MKNLSKSDIERRFKNSNWEPEVKLIELRKPLNFLSFKFNRMLSIVIPGHPIIDSRPRFLQKKDGTIGTYNPHKAQLMKIFKVIYDESPVLQGICIIGPMRIELDIYEKIPNNYKKSLNKQELELLKKQRLPALTKPDVDNGMKITYDVNQDLEYQVILRDEHVVDSQTSKIFVEDQYDERMVMRIYFSDDLPRWYKDILYDSNDYLLYNLSMKYKFINQIPDEIWGKEFFKILSNFIKRTKKNPVKTVNYIISKYKKSDLDLILQESTADRARAVILNLTEAIYLKYKMEGKK